jgi:hypothetical protein
MESNILLKDSVKMLFFGTGATWKNSTDSHENKHSKVAWVREPGCQKVMEFPLM